MAADAKNKSGLEVFDYKAGSVISKDGTSIGYRQMGKGPGLILIHGGMMASQNFMKLGSLLSDKFTVFIPDRRGRGLSGPAGDGYSLWKEVEDMQAIINKSGTHNVFGLSSGAVLALQTALIEPAIKKLALYEPPLHLKGEKSPVEHMSNVKYERALSEGNLGKALMCLIKGAGEMGLMSFIHGFMLEKFLNKAIELQQVKNDDVPLKKLIPTMHYDLKLVSDSKGIQEKCDKLDADVLLLGGSKSPGYLKSALKILAASLAHNKMTVFRGVGHTTADNRGKPEIVAQELSSFFNS